MKLEAAQRRERMRIRRERRVTYALKILCLLVLALVLTAALVDFLGRIPATGFLLTAALAFAYLIYPLVERLGRIMPRVAAILLVYLGIGLFAAAAAVLVVPPLSDDARQLIASFPDLIGRIRKEMIAPSNPLVRYIPASDRMYVANLPAQIGAIIQTYGIATAERTLGVLLSTVSILATFIIMPVLSAYVLLDAANIRRAFITLFPLRLQAKALAVLEDLDKTASGFIRGQIIDGVIVGTMIGTMLWLMHVRYALLIGVLGGVLNLIPYAGALVSFVPAVLLSLLYNGPANALVVTVLFAVIHQVDGNFISPRVLKASVGLSPVWIILAILVGSELFGAAGTFLAVPISAMLRVLVLHFVPRAAAHLENSQKSATPS
jgi:predicted PurR-regulated permease PerM